jgi:hypothetical protein
MLALTVQNNKSGELNCVIEENVREKIGEKMVVGLGRLQNFEEIYDLWIK